MSERLACCFKAFTRPSVQGAIQRNRLGATSAAGAGPGGRDAEGTPHTTVCARQRVVSFASLPRGNHLGASSAAGAGPGGRDAEGTPHTTVCARQRVVSVQAPLLGRTGHRQRPTPRRHPLLHSPPLPRRCTAAPLCFKVAAAGQRLAESDRRIR